MLRQRTALRWCDRYDRQMLDFRHQMAFVPKPNKRPVFLLFSQTSLTGSETMSVAQDAFCEGCEEELVKCTICDERKCIECESDDLPRCICAHHILCI